MNKELLKIMHAIAEVEEERGTRKRLVLHLKTLVTERQNSWAKLVKMRKVNCTDFVCFIVLKCNM